MGVWDTVGSLGIPGSLLAAGNKEKFAFHDTNPSPLVKRAVQALAIDEHRHDFTLTFWGPVLSLPTLGPDRQRMQRTIPTC